MINAQSEADYLWRGLRAAIRFGLGRFGAWLRYGHIVRAKAVAQYLASHSVRKLHLAATYEADGFLNSQVTGRVPIDMARPLPLPDGSFDMIYSSHVVEHLQRREFLRFLAEAHRTLRPGGQLVIATPSLRKIVDVLYGRDTEEKALLLDRGRRFVSDGFYTPCHQINIIMRAFGHRFLYDLEFMREAGKMAGFRSVQSIDNRAVPDPALRSYIASRKAPGWLIETETFVLEK